MGRGHLAQQRVVETLGALGLALPAATGIAPVLTSIAAIGPAIAMALAAATHARHRGEGQMMMTDWYSSPPGSSPVTVRTAPPRGRGAPAPPGTGTR